MAPEPESAPESEELNEQASEELTAAQLQVLLDEALAEAEAGKDSALRAQAEMENLRRRASRDVENAHKFGVERLINELLPVVDSLELGLQAGAAENASVESLCEGGELTLKMFKGALEKYDVLAVDPQDAPFDPEFHQAMSMQEHEGTAPGTVLQVVQKGYTLNGRLVRPAMVIVSK
ncbi:MAG: nucleotide exchange factor GrpE [Gammaproteobacteria bacterium]|nr:nucleotide exchange factor GrpE [Gammaproteobacteria bacterium]